MRVAMLMIHVAMLCSVGFASRVRIHSSDAAKEKVVSFTSLGPSKRFEVEVPPNSLPGDVLRVTVGCHDKKITVPDGATPGTVLVYDVEDKCCKSTPMSDMGFHHEFIIPAGSVPGDVFKVCAKDKEYTITVPEGGEPGMGLVFRTRKRKSPPPGFPPPLQKTTDDVHASFKSMSLQELLDSRDDELAKTGDLTQRRLEMEIKKRIEQGETVEMQGAAEQDEVEIDDLVDLPAKMEELSVDISTFFDNQKTKRVGPVTYLCCCQGHVAAWSKYINCEVVPEKEKNLFEKARCGGAKGDTWHSFNNMGDKYSEHWYYGRCVVPLSKPIDFFSVYPKPKLDFDTYPQCLDGVCS
jgi:hypothetical protein